VVRQQASPSATSRSTELARTFLAEQQRHHPGLPVRTVDVWQLGLPEFDDAMIAAKFAVLREQAATPAQQALWARAVALSHASNGATKVVVSTPMWNFGLPYRLKHYMDVVTLPGQNWRWSRDTGYEGLLAGRKAALICSSAGDYPVDPLDAGSDFQKPPLRRWLRFLGITDVVEVTSGPTLAPPDTVARSMERAHAECRRLAAAF
jgi:FMN-dependent NADH-azoreductase